MIASFSFIALGSSCSNLNPQASSQSHSRYSAQELSSENTMDSDKTLGVEHDDDEFPVSEVGNFRRGDPFNLSCQSTESNKMNCKLQGAELSDVSCSKASLFYRNDNAPGSQLERVDFDCSNKDFDLDVPTGATDIFVKAEVNQGTDGQKTSIQTSLPALPEVSEPEPVLIDATTPVVVENGVEDENTDPTVAVEEKLMNKADFLFEMNFLSTNRVGEANSATRFANDLNPDSVSDPFINDIGRDASNGFKLGAWIKIDELPTRNEQMVFVKLINDFDINIRWSSLKGFWSKMSCGQNPPSIIKSASVIDVNKIDWYFVELEVIKVNDAMQAKLAVSVRDADAGSMDVLFSEVQDLDSDCMNIYIDKIKIGPADYAYKAFIDDVELTIY